MTRDDRVSSTASSLMQDVPGAFPERTEPEDNSDYVSMSQAIHARRADFVRPRHVRIKVGTWNVASYKGTEHDVGGWFVEGKGVTQALAGLAVSDDVDSDLIPDQAAIEDREDAATQEARYKRKKSTIPKDDPGCLPGNEDVGLYVLGLQEVVDVNSVSEALRPYTDPGVANKWKQSMEKALPDGYQLVVEQQLIGMLLLVYAAPNVAREVKSVSTTSVGTGIGGYMGNKGAVTARIVLGETTRLVFVNCHMSAGSGKNNLERRNWDAEQIVSRTRFEPIREVMGLQQTKGEQIGDEDIAFWMGDLNYRLEGIPGDDVRRLLMLHTRNEYDLSQRSAQKIERELQDTTNAINKRTSRLSHDSSLTDSSARSSFDTMSSTDTGRSTQSTAPTIIDELAASDDPTSLQTTISSLLPHDELHQQMKSRRAFHDGWQEGPITFLPTYKYDVGSVGVFDSSEKKRAPSWCDRILYRTRRDKLAYHARIADEEQARKKDEEMKANGADDASNDESILYDYDPDNDAADPNEEYDEYEDAAEGVVVTKEGFEDELQLEYYTAHQRVLSSDHKPLNAVFMLKYDAVVPDLKAKVYAEVVKELDKAENEGRPSITVVVDRHSEADAETTDDDPTNFEGVWFGSIRWAQAKHRTLTVANTGQVPASFSFIERPVSLNQNPGIAPKWLNIKVNDSSVASSSKGTESIHLEPGETSSIELELQIYDVHIVRLLNQGLLDLDDILVLRVENGRDHFVPVRANWQATTLSTSIDKLVRIPEGGIRKLQRQKPDSSKNHRVSSSSVDSSSPTSATSEHSLPVRFSAPRELFKLTEAVEDLVTRLVAEFEMTHSPSGGATSSEASHDEEPSPEPAVAPWAEHPGWPFSEDSWVERDTEIWREALSAGCDALDTDQPLQESLPASLPRTQKLYVLADLLLTYLRHIPDGVIPAHLWTQIETYLSELDKTKTKPPLDEQKTAIQELLLQSPPHSISFVLLVNMLSRIAQETTVSSAAVIEETLSPSKRPVDALKRIATLRKTPAQHTLAKEKPINTLARRFADVLVGEETDSGQKGPRPQSHGRKVEVLTRFLQKDVG